VVTSVGTGISFLHAEHVAEWNFILYRRQAQLVNQEVRKSIVSLLLVTGNEISSMEQRSSHCFEKSTQAALDGSCAYSGYTQVALCRAVNVSLQEYRNVGYTAVTQSAYERQKAKSPLLGMG
jgi:hypothetical protein